MSFYTDPAGPRWDRKPGETMFDSSERLTAGERARDVVRRFASQPCGCCVSGDAAELRDFITRAIEAAVKAEGRSAIQTTSTTGPHSTAAS